MGGAEEQPERPALICVVGPTASGKSQLALQLARRHGGEIISADSVQVYRYFDIGSGKPTTQELARAPHHLIDCAEPDENWDASLFRQRAEAVVAAVRRRGHTPIVCGGTFLWVRALVYGLAPAPPKDEAIRQRHRDYVARHGREALHERLRDADPPSFERLMPNDFVRVSRALEVYELTGRPLSELQRAHGFRQPRYRAHLVGIQHEPAALTQRIHERVWQMLRAGWVDEVRGLVDRGYRQARPMTSVGYRQVLAALDARPAPTRAQLAEEITRVTRIFARRQRTWLRDQPVHWLTENESRNFELPRAWLED